MPIVLFVIWTFLKEDLQVTAAELTYGTSLRLHWLRSLTRTKFQHHNLSPSWNQRCRSWDQAIIQGNLFLCRSSHLHAVTSSRSRLQGRSNQTSALTAVCWTLSCGSSEEKGLHCGREWQATCLPSMMSADSLAIDQMNFSYPYLNRRHQPLQLRTS